MQNKSQPVPDGPIRLQVRVSEAVQRFFWAVPGGDWQPLGPALDARAHFVQNGIALLLHLVDARLPVLLLLFLRIERQSFVGRRTRVWGTDRLLKLVEHPAVAVDERVFVLGQ
jgi:hypothetical protein